MSPEEQIKDLESRLEDAEYSIEKLQNALIDLCYTTKNESITGLQLLNFLKKYGVI